MGATNTMTAVDFLNRIDVDTHIPYTDGGYANLANVQADLNYLGVKELRDGISDGEYGSAPLASYIQLAKAGEKFTFVVGGGASTDASIQYTLGEIARLAAAVPGSVKAVEGPNEINNQTLTFNGVGGLQSAVALQQYLYQTVKGTPALSGVAVDYFTGYNTVGFAAGPDPSMTAGLADYDTQHPYPQGGQAPAYWVDPSTALGNEPGTKGSFVYTETGYTTNLSSADGVDATVQGKYILDLLMDAAKGGSSGTYLYQLMDAYKPGSPQGDDGYGLFDENNNPKLAATGIHNIAAILADNGTTASSFTPISMKYSVSGQSSTGNSLEISKSDGTTDIAVWAEPQLWNASTKSEVAAPSETETVNLDGTHQVSVYDPLSGTAPIATYGSTSSVQLQVTDHPLIIEIKPATANTSAVNTSAVNTSAVNTNTNTVNAVPAPSVDRAAPDVQQVASPPTSDPSPTITVPVTSTSVASVPVVGPVTAHADASPTADIRGTGQAAIDGDIVPVGTASTAVTSTDAVGPAPAPTVDQTAIAQVAPPPSPGASPTITDPVANTAITDLPAMAVTTLHMNGSSTVNLQDEGQTVSSNWHDIFLNHGMPDNTFTFSPGYGRDVVNLFRAGGVDHDIVNLQGSDFGESIAQVLRNTTMVHGDAVIADPTTGDTVRLTGVTRAQLVHNKRDITFHP